MVLTAAHEDASDLINSVVRKDSISAIDAAILVLNAITFWAFGFIAAAADMFVFPPHFAVAEITPTMTWPRVLAAAARTKTSSCRRV